MSEYRVLVLIAAPNDSNMIVITEVSFSEGLSPPLIGDSLALELATRLNTGFEIDSIIPLSNNSTQYTLIKETRSHCCC